MEHGIDIRDWYMPGGGDSRLTTRRLLLIVDKVLNHESSRFWRAVTGSQPLDATGIILSDIFSSITGESHSLRELFYDEKSFYEKLGKDAKKSQERQKKREAIKAQMRLEQSHG